MAENYISKVKLIKNNQPVVYNLVDKSYIQGIQGHQSNYDELKGYIFDKEVLLDSYIDNYDPMIGNQGIQGVQGRLGKKGTNGKKGFQGFQGYQGDNGYRGIQGVQGVQKNGEDGTDGNMGKRGHQGFQGDIGQDGNQGKQGKKGNKGTKGTKGNQGDLGFQGIQGDQGNDGPLGKQGTQGSIGLKGKKGNKPAKGYQGIQGVSGIAGEQGTQGPIGTCGTAKKGHQGNKGKMGPQGTHGPQGIPQKYIKYNDVSSSIGALIGHPYDLDRIFYPIINPFYLLSSQKIGEDPVLTSPNGKYYNYMFRVNHNGYGDGITKYYTVFINNEDLDKVDVNIYDPELNDFMDKPSTYSPKSFARYDRDYQTRELIKNYHGITKNEYDQYELKYGHGLLGDEGVQGNLGACGLPHDGLDLFVESQEDKILIQSGTSEFFSQYTTEVNYNLPWNTRLDHNTFSINDIYEFLKRNGIVRAINIILGLEGIY